MANFLQKTVKRSLGNQLSFDQWVSFFEFGGLNYPFTFQQTLGGKTEAADANMSFDGLVLSGYKSNGVIFACMLARQKLFSEARFAFRQRMNGRPGDLFGTKELALLERPWPGGVTGDLLARAIQDVDLAGNFFAVRRPNRIRRLRPDYVTIVLGSMDDPSVEAGDIDAEVVGYVYHPGGRGATGRAPVLLLREEVAHFAPVPDPAASFRGMSWLLPIFREFQSDTAMTVHKMRFFENGATPNMVVTLDPSIKKEAFKEWVQMFSEKHEGVLNAYKTLYLGAGSTIMPVGKDFKQMDFAVTQAIGETRICSAAGVPPVLVGVTEGIRASTYSNYQQAKRYFADGTLRPLWRNIASSLEMLVNVPNNAELWYDDTDIPFLDEDAKDDAEIQSLNAQSIKALVDAGFEADSVVEAVGAGDLSRLTHTGLFSVQLQPPGTVFVPPTAAPPTPPAPAPKANGNNGGRSRDEVVDLLKHIAEQRSRDEIIEALRSLASQRSPVVVSSPAPNVEVNIHEGALRVESPVAVDARTTIAEGAVRVDAQTTIADGAVRVEPRVDVGSPIVTLEDGAVRAEFQLVDGAIRVVSPVTIEEGAVQVSAPVNVERTEVNISEGAVRVDAPTTIAEGAVRVDAPVTVERTEVHVDEGAVRVDAPVTVERTEVRIEEGAVRVDAPVTVERTEVHVDPGAVSVDARTAIEEGAVRVDAPVTVERTEVHVDEGAVRVDASTTIAEGAVQVDSPVTVERTEVHVDEGAVRVDAPVTIEEGAVRVDAPVTVERTDVQVDAPVTVHPAEVTIAEGAVRVDAPVTLSEGAVKVDSQVTMQRGSVEVQVDAPVSIEDGAIRVDSPVTIERGAVEVNVDAPVTEVNLPEPETPPARRVVRETEFRTNEAGQIVGKREVETDEPEDEDD